MDRFSLEVNALTPANVALYQIERNTKTIVTATVDSSDERQLGKVGAVPARGIVQGLVVLGQTASTGAPEMAGLCTATFEQQQWFVTGRGEIAANELGVVLRPRGTATVKGVGETYSGVYLVTPRDPRFLVRWLHPALRGEAQRAVAHGLGGLRRQRRWSARRGDLAMTSSTERIVADLVQRVESQYYGKYRGIVVDNA